MSDQGKDQSEEEIWKELEAAETGKQEPKFADGEEKDKDAPAEEAAAPPEPPAQQQPDIWANAPPDLKAAHDAQVKALESAQTDHARRSIEGRIASYTRRLQERMSAAAQPPQPAPTEEAADPLVDLAAEYPEIAKPLEAKLAPITAKISQFDAQLASRQQAADAQMDADLKANEELLKEQHPGWEEYLHEYGAAFGAWIVDQPLYYRQAFVNNEHAIIDPYSAIETLAAFKTFVAANTQPPPQGAAPAAVNARLNPRRAAQLAGSASPYAASARPVVNGIPQDGDEQAIWNAFRDTDPDERKYRNA